MRSKDAMGVSLLFVALGKKNVLSALAKLTQSRSNKVRLVYCRWSCTITTAMLTCEAMNMTTESSLVLG